MEIKQLKADKNAELSWDKYIMNNNSTSFFQQIGWKNVIEKTYRHLSFYLYAEENNEIIGILPLFFVKSLIFGNRMISVPYGPYGGCSANTVYIKECLVKEAICLSKTLNVKYLELRNFENIQSFPSNDKYVTLFLDLAAGEQAVWAELRKGMKACVKRAAKEDFHTILNSNNLGGFYTVYSMNMHHLGTPVPPFSFFRNISENFPEMKVATIDYNGEIVAAQVLLPFKKTMIYGWGASSKRYSDAHPVHGLLWNVIQNSISSGYEIFDFGRSAQGSGTYDFKKWWGAVPVNLYYQYPLNKEPEIPNIHPTNPKYSTAIKIWRKLPLRVANWLGPIASKELV